MVNTQDATLGNNFDSRQLTDLPSEGRDPVSILSLQPGVVYIGNQVNRDDDSRSGSVNGARSDQTNVTLDGLDDNDQLNGYAFTGAMRATLDSLQEFRVTTSNYDAASGRSSGAQVNLVTKSGTNNFHGSVYEYHRPTIGVALEAEVDEIGLQIVFLAVRRDDLVLSDRLRGELPGDLEVAVVVAVVAEHEIDMHSVAGANDVRIRLHPGVVRGRRERGDE